MNIKIVSKDLIATDAIKDYIGKKSERLVKYFGEDFDVTATIKTEGGLQVAEMEVKTPTIDLEQQQSIKIYMPLLIKILIFWKVKLEK